MATWMLSTSCLFAVRLLLFSAQVPSCGATHPSESQAAARCCRECGRRALLPSTLFVPLMLFSLCCATFLPFARFVNKQAFSVSVLPTNHFGRMLYVDIVK
jgi:hypothetical protein